MKVVLYARVSTRDRDQDPETQLLALRDYCDRAGWEICREYVDYASARNYRRRVAWRQLEKDLQARRFKTVVVWKLDRAWRNLRDCVVTLERWDALGITLKSVTQEVIDTTTAAGTFILQIMAASAQFESETISERVTAGMERARRQGTRSGLAIGRPSKIRDPRLIKRFLKLLPEFQAGELSKGEIARRLGIDRRSLGRLMDLVDMETQAERHGDAEEAECQPETTPV